MHECSVCGVLSIGVDVCPACGSRIHKEIQQGDIQDAIGGLPGLSEAMASWKEVVPDHDIPVELETNTASTSSLPFSFQGQSNQFDEALPFGIGSNSEGIPFEYSGLGTPSKEKTDSMPKSDVGTKITDDSINTIPVSENNIVPPPSPDGDVSQMTSNPVPINQDQNKEKSGKITDLNSSPLPGTKSIDDIQNDDTVIQQEVKPPELSDLGMSDPKQDHVESSSASQTNTVLEVQNAPAAWSIHAEPVDLAQMNAELESVVKYEHHEEVDVIEYVHSKEIEADEVTESDDSGSFILFPTRAQAVELADKSQKETLEQAFNSMANAQWSDSAKLFQKIIAKQPQDPAVMNNYGLSLMERALEIEAIDDPTSADKAYTQYKTAIMVLKEAAKLEPSNLDCLYNLAHALLLSGREDKCITIVERIQGIEGKTPQTSMLKSACLYNQGLFDMAKAEISEFSAMDIIQHNLKVIPGL